MTTFDLTLGERLRLDAWNQAHLNESHAGVEPDIGAIGGRLTFEFTPTSLGVIKKVRCACGWTADLTFYEEW